MTTRLKGVLVTFEDDIREDDAEAMIGAIRMVKGVLTVAPVPASFEDDMARDRVRAEFRDKLIDMFWPKRNATR
jgi:hypothetical protein